MKGNVIKFCISVNDNNVELAHKWGGKSSICLASKDETKLIYKVMVRCLLVKVVYRLWNCFHYENMNIQIHWKFYHQKMAIFQIKNSDIFQFSAQNIDCGYSLELPHRGGSNEYPQSLFLSRNKKNNVYPCKPQFYYIKVGFKGVKVI